MSQLQFAQHTFATKCETKGIGVHSGAPATITFHPAPIGTGLVFRRTDITDKNNAIPADYLHVADTRMCSCFANAEGVTVSTAEHVMGALSAFGISNAFIDVSGPEIPILDGSAKPFVELFKAAGVEAQDAPQKALKIKKEITFTDDKGLSVTFKPAASGLSFDFEIDFPAKAIGHQSYHFDLTKENFEKEIGFARTFGQLQEVEYLRSIGLARGGSLENVIVVDNDKILNPEGLRNELEFVRHKILDAVGDLYQAGMPIIGSFSGAKTGHYHNNMILREIFKDPTSYEIVDLNA